MIKITTLLLLTLTTAASSAHDFRCTTSADDIEISHNPWPDVEWIQLPTLPFCEDLYETLYGRSKDEILMWKYAILPAVIGHCRSLLRKEVENRFSNYAQENLDRIDQIFGDRLL